MEDVMYRVKTFFFTKKIFTGVMLALFLGEVTSNVLAKESSRKGYLGVSIERLSHSEKEEMGVSHGVLVTHVVKDGPAEKAGILEDDVILYFDGKKILRPDRLTDAVREKNPGTEVKITLFRDKTEKEVTVKIGKLPARSITLEWKGDKYILGGGVYLGVQMQSLNKDLAGYFGVKEDGGALVLEVKEDSPAEKAGLKAGDVIVRMDKEDVTTPDDVIEILSDFDEGDQVEIEVIRQGKKQTFNVELEARPHSSDIRILKGIFEKERGKGRIFHLRIPDIESIEIPKLDREMYWNDDVKSRLEEKLNGIQEKLNKRLEVVKETICA